MAEKILNTKIQQRYDTLENWESNNPVLLKGEIALVEVSSNNNLVHNAPTVLMKVGDGESTFSELEYSSSLASDVYSWAKNSTKPTYTSNEIDIPLVSNGDNIDYTTQGIVPMTGANRFAFLPADQIIVEQSTDGGVTWQEYAGALSDQKKVALFSDINSPFYIPLKNGVRSCDCMLRISITAMKYNVPENTPETEKFNYWNNNYVTEQERYCNPNLFSIFLSSVTDRIQLKIEYYRGDGQKYSIVSTYDGLRGYSGRNNLKGIGVAFGGATTQLTNIWNYRFTFRTQAVDGSFDDSKLDTSTNTISQNISSIQAFSNNCWSYSNMMMYNNHIYDYDYLQNVSFLGNILPTSGEKYYLGTSSKLWAGVFAKWGNFSNYVYENGSPLQDRYISFTLDSNNYPALCSRGANSLTPYQYIRTGTVGVLPYTLTDSEGGWTNAVCRIGSSDYRFSESYIANIYANNITVDSNVNVKGNILENGTPLSNKYVQLDYSDGNAVAFFNPQGQSPTYIKAGLSGILPYTSADNWESSSGYVGAHGARFATSYIKDMYANVISADNQISAAVFVENGTSLSAKYALKSELPSTKQILTAYTGSENIGFASTANTRTTKVITLNTTLQENDVVRVYVSGMGAYASQNAGVITFEVAKGSDNTKLMGSGSTFTATGGTSGIIFANVNVTPNQLVCGTYALTDTSYPSASDCDVFKVTIERNTN